MKTQVKLAGLSCMLLVALTARPLQAQFQAIVAGAESSAANSKLVFANAAEFGGASGFVQPLVYTIVTNFVLTNVIYSTTNLQVWSLAKTNEGSAAVGAYIVAEVMSVAGPGGGVLSFWEQGWRTPTYIFPVGVPPTVGSNRFDVSDISSSAGLPDGDPIGRIPLRRFTVDTPGEYSITLKLFDTSTNSPAWGPMHTPSDPITVKFATGLDLAVTRYVRNPTNAVETLVFKQSALTNLYVEANTNLATDDWLPIAGPFATAPALNNTTTLNFTNAEMASRFYRLRGEAP